MMNLLVYTALFVCSCFAQRQKGPGPVAQPVTADEDEEKTTSPSYSSLWLASIWWEAGYQQGKSDSKTPTCNEIRTTMIMQDIFSEHMLPNCKENGHWTSLQCGEKNCWCAFLDAGYRIQSIPFVGRNESSVCPKLYMFGKDPCRVTPEPLVNCQNARSPKMKWIYDKLQKQCIYIQSCSGFPSELDCASTCVPESFSLCTLPLNDGDCSKTSQSSNPGSVMGSSSVSAGNLGLLSSITQDRVYFDQQSSSCKPFKYGRCGGNSNNFETATMCMGACIKDTKLTVLAKVGNQILRLTLPAWLVVQLNLSQTEARDVPPNDVPMIFAHSFTTSTGGDDNSVEVIQMSGPIAPRFAKIESQEEIEIRPIRVIQPTMFTAQSLSPRCQSNPDPGECRSWSPRWYYDEKVGGCKIFGWGGCWGIKNREEQNNFKGKYECVLKCAPIVNLKDSSEINKWLAAGDPINEPGSSMPNIQVANPQNQIQNFDVEYNGIKPPRPGQNQVLPIG